MPLQVYDLAEVQRRGDDLHSVLELTLYDALLGGSVPVRTVRGHRHIMVPAGEPEEPGLLPAGRSPAPQLSITRVVWALL